MGGTLMEQLVSRAYWLKDSSKRIIVQPQSHAEDIRKFFVENGFRILFEDACVDSGKLYCAMAAEYTGDNIEKSESYIYMGELPSCQKKEARLYLQKIVSRLRKKAESERLHGSADEAEKLERIIAETEEKINAMQTDG